MQDTYDILDETGKAINIIVWDGVTEYTAPENCTVVPHDPERWNPTPVPEVRERSWNEYDVRNNLTLAEKVKWDNDSDPIIVTSKKELTLGVNLEGVTEILNMLVSSGIISEASKTKILQ